MIQIRRILHPTDFSKNSQLAIPYVRHFADQYGAEVHVLHVLEPVVSTTDFTWAGLNYAELEQRRLASAREALQRLLEESAFSGLQIVQAIERGKSHDVIRSYVEEHGVDLVILATHGHTGLTHLLLGSTAEMVVRTVTCPVLTVKGAAPTSDVDEP
jgi:nucleotide-binding universal stress UspA family protein